MTQFANDGYCLLPGLLAPDAVECAREAVCEVIAKPHGETCERPNNTLVPLRWDDEIVALVTGDGRRLAESVGADDLRLISGYISIKTPKSPPLWWHQDWWCWDHPVSYHPAAAQVALLCYLCDTDSRNGALRVLPGSHLRSVPLHAVLPEAHADDAAALDPAHPSMTDHEGQVTLDLAAGDAAVIDYRLLHGTHANDSDRRRDCVLVSFAPNWRSLPSDIRGHLIQHPALPIDAEEQASSMALRGLLPSFDGIRHDLTLNRNAPREFETQGRITVKQFARRAEHGTGVTRR